MSKVARVLFFAGSNFQKYLALDNKEIPIQCQSSLLIITTQTLNNLTICKAVFKLHISSVVVHFRRSYFSHLLHTWMQCLF